MRVLLVEDEEKLAALVARGLTERGDVVDVVGTGTQALASAREGEYDVVLLDVMLPDLDGFAVCQRLRAERVWTPVLMLTARTAIGDRITGLDSGADDYLAKPFAFQELLARMRALARRGPVRRPTELEVGDLRLDPAGRRVWRGATEVSLSTREFTLLETLMRRPDQVLTREQLLGLAWGDNHDVASNVVDGGEAGVPSGQGLNGDHGLNARGKASCAHRFDGQSCPGRKYGGGTNASCRMQAPWRFHVL